MTDKTKFKSPVNLALLVLSISLTGLCSIALADKVKTRINNVEGINQAMLTPEYWQANLTEPEQVVLSKDEIVQHNVALFKRNSNMIELEELASRINKDELTSLILSISKKPTSKRYFSNQQILTAKDYSGYQANLNLSAIADTTKVQYGMVVERTDLRTFPTTDKVFKTDDDINLDRFQETALFPSQVVAIYHKSKDGRWLFVSSYNYSAWVRAEHIAQGNKQIIFAHRRAEPFLVITGDKVFTSSNPYNEKISQLQLEMGTRIPLVPEKDKPTVLDGQNTYASHVIQLPTRAEDGTLVLQPALIAKSQDVRIGYLELNKKHIVQQAFKFLGERYGWGHSFNARDCTGFVGEIYKSFGVLMPRNSGQQGVSQQGQNIRFSKTASNEDKLREINQLDTGDLIYLPGHVMMYLGQINDQPYVIHDVSGYSYFDDQGNYQKSQLNGVSVTPLIPLQLNQETSYIDRIYNLKKIK